MSFPNTIISAQNELLQEHVSMSVKNAVYYIRDTFPGENTLKAAGFRCRKNEVSESPEEPGLVLEDAQ